jgi:hypothetical protein
MAAPPRAKAPGLLCSPPSGQSRRPRYLSEYRLKPRAESHRPVGTKNPGLAPIVPLGQQPTADPSQEPTADPSQEPTADSSQEPTG